MASGLSNWQVDVADHRQLPVEDHSVDLVVSGWSVSYLAVWNPENGGTELDTWLTEMKRVLREGWNHYPFRIAWHRKRIAHSLGACRIDLSMVGRQWL